jgi:hypothetical protein
MGRSVSLLLSPRRSAVVLDSMHWIPACLDSVTDSGSAVTSRAPLARADGRNRTGNLRFTRAALYQLSYVGRLFASYRRDSRAGLRAAELRGL